MFYYNEKGQMVDSNSSEMIRYIDGNQQEARAEAAAQPINIARQRVIDAFLGMRLRHQRNAALAQYDSLVASGTAFEQAADEAIASQQ